MAPVVIDIRSADDTRDVVHRAVQALVEGKLVAFPTETVYGVAASALNAQAVQRLIDAKHRPAGQPLTLAVQSADAAYDYVPDMCPLGQRLARRCWPGPVTLVVKDRHPDSLLTQLPATVQESVTLEGNLGLRVPAHPTILDVLRMLAGPLVLSSANRSGEPDAVTAEQLVENLGDDVQLVLDDGRSRYAQPSSVVRVDEHGFKLLREGVVSEQALRRLSSYMILFVCTGNTCRSPMAEALCRKLLSAKLDCPIEALEDRGILVVSAGVAAMMGGRAAPEAVQVLAQHGIDISRHETQPLTVQLVRNADVIFTMTRAHREAILNEWPEASERTKLLCRDRSDVADPIGGPYQLYQRCAQEIEAQLLEWINEIKIA